jgi:hypothetical protein
MIHDLMRQGWRDNQGPHRHHLRVVASLARSAEYASWQHAARIRGTLLAAIAMPIPVPQTSTPRSVSPDLIRSARATAISG